MHHARQTLKDAGYRLTPQRVAIWEVARKDGRHLTAEQIAEEVKRSLPEVSLSTVYRTLELLVSLDLVHETHLDGRRSYFEVAPDPVHHHFVCERCGTVGHFEDQLLANCYRRSLEVAVENGVRTIAFPAISTGIYGFPLDRATRIAVREVRAFLASNPPVDKVLFVCFDLRTHDVYQRVLTER